MKNFFKKLSFVLAIAMVLTSIAPATASAAEVVPAKKINVKVDGEKVDTINLKVGETEEVKIGLPVKKAFAGQKSTFKTAVVYESDAIEVVKVGNRKYEVTAVEAGEATITFGAAKTKKLANAGEFKVTKEVKVVVEAEAELSAVQAGVKKIHVTGTDLTDKVADYVVKRGSVTLTLASATKLEDGSVVLAASSSYLPKGDYTVSFKGGEAVEFTAEEGYVKEITVNPESAILDATNPKKAYTYFTIRNQFGEDVTRTEVGNCTITGATLDGYNKVVFTSGVDFSLNLSTVSLSIVCKTNGANYVDVLTVSSLAQLTETEFKGVYKLNAKTNLYEEAVPYEGLTNPAGYVLVFDVKDQYGYSAANNASYGAIQKLQVNLSSVTGAKVGTPFLLTANNLGDYVYSYVAYPINLIDGYTKLNAGEVTVLGIQTTDGKSIPGTFTVAELPKVASLNVIASEVYGNQDNVLEFVALDQAGNEITSYEVLSAMNAKFATSGNGLEFVPNPDGTAKLVYSASTVPYSEAAVAQPVVLTWLSMTNEFGSVNLSVKPNRVPKAIIGIDSWKAQGVTKNGTLTLKAQDFIYQDQYGNVISDANATAFNTIFGNSANQTISVSYVYGTPGAFTGAATSAAVSVAGNGTAVGTLTATNTSGYVTLSAKIDNVKASEYEFTLYNVDINNVSDYTIYPISSQNVSSEAAVTLGETDIYVYGYYAGKVIDLQPDQDYTIHSGNTVYQAAFGYTKDVYTSNLVVGILNQKGDTITKEFTYSNIAPYANTVEMYGKFFGNVSVAPGTYTTAGLFSTSTHSQLSGAANTTVLVVADQYDVAYTTAPRVTFSDYSADAETLNNGTANAQIKWAVAGYKTVNVTYTFANGKTFSTVIVVNVTNAQ